MIYGKLQGGGCVVTPFTPQSVDPPLTMQWPYPDVTDITEETGVTYRLSSDTGRMLIMGIHVKILLFFRLARFTFCARSYKKDAKSQLEPISPAVKKADDLVNELVDIKTEMNTVLADLEYDKIKEAQLYGPSPLDPYLIQPSKELQSPYKPKVAVPLQLAKTPPVSNFSDAREILREVRQTRACLEANLEAVQRSRREVEVYSVMENMYHESNAELDRIKKMVDKKVAIIRSQVEREVTDEVVRAEMNKNQPRIIPSSTAPPTMRGIGRGRVGARIDTGLSKIKGPSFGPPLVSKAVGKENVDSLRPAVTKAPPPKQPKLRSVFEDEDYMTRVYGKGSHQKGRSTVKNVPYLHYQNVPKTKAERPQAAPDTKNAHVVKSAKTQTGPFVKQFYFSPAHGAYFPVASSSAPIAGQLVPMAVPLGAPRIEGGLTQGVTIDTPSGPLTSTPASRPQVTAAGNVAMVSFAVEDDLETTPQPELSKQVLPAVDIETDISEVSPISSKTKTAATSKKGAGTSKSPPSKELSRTTRSPSHMGSKSPDRRSKGERVESPSRNSERKSTADVHFQSPQMSPSKRRLEDRDEAQGEEEDENTLTDVSEEDLPPEKAPGIELPGYHPPSPPPQPRPKEQDLPPRLAQMITQTMDVLDEDIQRRELLENKAVEWIEQELMSRIISDMPEINHPPPPRPRELAHEALDESQDSMAEEKEQSMFMMDCIGRAGLQIFVDAGQPVDAELVNALIKEVLEEKVSNMLGQRPDEEAQLGGQRSMPKLSAAPDADRIQEGRNIVEEEDDYRSHQIETPQPTPKYTPISSPERVISPPMTPPLSPVRTPRAAPVSLPEPAPVDVESEPESLSIDLSEELRNLRAKLSQPPVSTSPTREVHDVITPVPTPVPEPNPEPEPEPEVTRPITPPIPTPRQEVPVKVSHRGPVPTPVPKPISEPEPEPEVTRPVTPPIPTPRQEVPVKVVEAAKPVSIPPPKVEVPQPVEKGSQTEAPSLPESPKSQVESPVSERKPAKFVEKHEEQPEMVDRPLSPIIIESPAVKTTSPPPSESEESVIESSISDTIGQSVSEGQWLLNKSEGEIADFPIDEVQKMKLMHTARQQAEISTASTMRGTEDIQDESTEFPISEGEFQYKPTIMPDKDPLLLLMSRFQHQPVQPGQFDMTTDQVADFLDHTGKSIGELSMHPMEKSMGEVSYVKPKRSKGRQSPDRYQGLQSPDRYQGRQSPDRYQGRQSPDRYQGRGSRSPSPRKGRQSPEGQYNNNGRRSPGQGRWSPGQGRQSPGMGRRSPERDQYYRGESPTMDGYYQERDVDYGRKSPTRRRTNDRRSPSVSFEDEVNGRVSPQRARSRDSPGRGRQSPGHEVEKVTIETTTTTRRHHHSPSGQGRPAGQGRRTPTKPSTPGGVSLGGSLTAGRTSPLKSSLRKPPLSQGVPEKSVTLSGTRTFNVRASDERYSQEDRLSMSDRGTHAFTPDQMNMEELLASGYLTQTFSDSQGANSLRSSRGSQGISPDRQRKKGKSLGLTYSFESEGSESYSMSELKRLAGSGSLGMSGTAETGEFGESFSYADNL
ncbi:hypothetical protein FSP39_024713 [Pinctada imbricata]|uniref:TALPID3 n=1 Tax=Pinctada imbricata TaxID=66713 RepID=A0AA88XYB2_PINIB|nr:hypothetical protein FSP39_024713 [Pinctada imbricata]